MSMVPEKLWRDPTAESIAKLAKLFSLPNESWMQDWDLQVADPVRVDEFLAAYRNLPFTDDDKFTLMEIIVASLNDLEGADLASHPAWHEARGILREQCVLHADTICYWSCIEEPDVAECFSITPYMREIWQAVEGRLTG